MARPWREARFFGWYRGGRLIDSRAVTVPSLDLP